MTGYVSDPSTKPDPEPSKSGYGSAALAAALQLSVIKHYYHVYCNHMDNYY